MQKCIKSVLNIKKHGQKIKEKILSASTKYNINYNSSEEIRIQHTSNLNA
jgi:hypothetical protein